MNGARGTRLEPSHALAPDHDRFTGTFARVPLHRDQRFWTRIVLAALLTFVAAALVAIIVALQGGWAHGLGWEVAILGWLDVRLPAVLDSLAVYLPWLGTNLIFIPVLGPACWYLWRKRRRPDIATMIAVTTVGNWLIGTALKVAFARARPGLWTPRGEYTGTSYPSGHAMAVTSVIGIVAILICEERGVVWPLPAWIALLIATCYSRLYLGVHWPTDVLGGLLAGGVWLAGVLWSRRRRSE